MQNLHSDWVNSLFTLKRANQSYHTGPGSKLYGWLLCATVCSNTLDKLSRGWEGDLVELSSSWMWRVWSWDKTAAAATWVLTNSLWWQLTACSFPFPFPIIAFQTVGQ